VAQLELKVELVEQVLQTILIIHVQRTQVVEVVV
jgi:hypothetical protein